MPIWRIRCEECGHGESALRSNSWREANGGLVPCGACGAPNVVRPTAPRVATAHLSVTGLGEGTVKDLERRAEANGKVLMPPSDPMRRQIRDQAREMADESAQAQGFKDVHDRRERWAKEKTKVDLRVKDQQRSDYIKKHGSDAGKTPIEKAFGPS